MKDVKSEKAFLNEKNLDFKKIFKNFFSVFFRFSVSFFEDIRSMKEAKSENGFLNEKN
jgi:hypothetical protein